MSAAGIIAHCLAASAPPVPTVLVWWTAGDEIVQKVRFDQGFMKQYLLPSGDVRQPITVDVPRNRVFVPTNDGVYVFEDTTADGDIPAPTLVAVPNIGNQNAWTWNNAISLDQATGQLFLANGSNDSVSIIDTDNSVTTVSGIDLDAFMIKALGSGKFTVANGSFTTQIWGPSNSYAAPLVDEFLFTAEIGTTVYDPDNDRLITYLAADVGGLRFIDVDTGNVTYEEIDNHYGYFMHRLDNGNVVINQTGDNGKLWVFNPSGGVEVAAVDYSATVPGGTPGIITDIKSMGTVVTVLHRWNIAAVDHMVAHVFDASTGTVLATHILGTTGSGLPYSLGVDPTNEEFAYAHAATDLIYLMWQGDPSDLYDLTTFDVGGNAVAASYLPES